ncbi:hypothetical protein CBM2626_U40001 [Cupriavidus taiwanensis]|uniref:Uncharacterized protein n=1 Tax=Cupriavidus taiwanensis TaxID=164546 RepID=A0A375FMD1_9BURK|nr:hypothetical protein [Cupriavidus taiwanensis]SOZ73323.1 hypothetical protein CBM2614_U40001 [Cupriavidus taiwanensis]SOZ73876.1 hypothetical protein CBM2615_U30001 [Cupriavidus taiwanensis]SOZ75307.1 hypothetical protein CBM2613_U30001 [Cupriavidus taiwanensis]SPA03863.1 hypothetical protein CBM2626_U40001 [Cupriavidus taiwanensis]SPA12955.1 hypothetical protein CBM2625_U70020 [Cupriavidus taiwanensis]
MTDAEKLRAVAALIGGNATIDPLVSDEDMLQLSLILSIGIKAEHRGSRPCVKAYIQGGKPPERGPVTFIDECGSLDAAKRSGRI